MSQDFTNDRTINKGPIFLLENELDEFDDEGADIDTTTMN